MTNITAVLLVLTLTGAPVASVVCVTECQQQADTPGHCHNDMAANAGSRLATAFNCSAPWIGESPFIAEQRATIGAAIFITTWSGTEPAVVKVGAPVVRFKVSDSALTSPLVLRI